MRFDQVKILARDLEALAAFYIEALDCVVVLPEQSTAHVAARGVGVPYAEVTAAHA